MWLILVITHLVTFSAAAPVSVVGVEETGTDFNRTSESSYTQIVRVNGNSTRLVNVSPPDQILPSVFLVIGIHSFLSNVTFCDGQESLATGQNFGTIIFLNSNQSRSICIQNPNNETINVLLLANIFHKPNPIPGGCNIEFPLEMSPYMNVRQSGKLLIASIEFPPAAIGNELNMKRMCSLASRKRLHYQLFAYSIESEIREESRYFQVISSMSDLQWLTRNAHMLMELNNQMFRIYFASNLNQQIFFTIVLCDSAIPTGAKSLYVPNQIINRAEFDWLVMVVLSLFAISSALVSTVGHRKFILEVFYFSFLLIFGLSLLVTPHIRYLESSRQLVFYCILFSSVVATTWTAVCRWSRNLRLALSAHSLVLSFWITSLLFHLYLLLFNTFHVNELYLNIFLSLSTISIHILLSLALDLFWMSALSTSIITVYLSILPFDLLLNGSLYHIILNVWLYNRYIQYSVVNLITVTAKDVIVLVLFSLFVTGSICWQLWSKIGNLSYGFACIATSASSTSSSPNRRSKKKRKAKRKYYRCKYCHKISASENPRSRCRRSRSKRKRNNLDTGNQEKAIVF